jgi:hypothetical protein
MEPAMTSAAEAVSRVYALGRHGLAMARAENANFRPPAAAKDVDFRIGSGIRKG